MRNGNLAAVSPPRPTSAPSVSLAEVAALAGAPLGSWSGGSPFLHGVSLDSRSVRPGDLYAALPGFTTHGAAFARQAVDNGAAAILTDSAGARDTRGVDVPVVVVDDPRAVLGEVASYVYGDPAFSLTLLGITGTNGKTTTAYLLESGLRALGVATGLIGTVETRIGASRLKSVRTTPEATDLHAIFAVMREEGASAVVMEVSSHALAQHRVDGAVFDVAVFTNLSQDHLDFHASMDDYFAAKASLFTPAHSRRGVVCVDDEWGQRLLREAQVPVVTVASVPTRSGIRVDYRIRPGQWPSFVLEGPTGDLTLQCHLPGQFNVVNTALAAVTLLEAGHPLDAVGRALAHEPVVPGRMEVVTPTVPDPEGDPRCIVDFAHTPAAVEAALRALRPTTPGRLVVVLGAGGDRDHGKRPGMGVAAAHWADDIIVTDDNPRSEDPAAIRAEVMAGAGDAAAAPPHPHIAAARPDTRTRYTSDAGRAQHIARAVRLAREARPAADNTVVVLGKGHESGQEIAGVVHPFDDRDALRAALDGVPYEPELRP